MALSIGFSCRGEVSWRFCLNWWPVLSYQVDPIVPRQGSVGVPDDPGSGSNAPQTYTVDSPSPTLVIVLTHKRRSTRADGLAALSSSATNEPQTLRPQCAIHPRHGNAMENGRCTWPAPLPIPRRRRERGAFPGFHVLQHHRGVVS